MANEFEVTIHIWRNSPRFEYVQDNRHDKTRYADLTAGHASLKLQHQGANKGDYLYLSFWPDFTRQSHNMALSYGVPSKDIKVLNRFHELQTWSFSSDVEIEGGARADRTYRFTGPDFAAMRAFIQGLGNNRQNRWHLKKYNCAEAVADCLTAGGAPQKPAFAGRFTPNRLEAWCKILVKHYHGEKKYPLTGAVKIYPDVF